MQGLQPAEVYLDHAVPLVWLGDGAATHKHGERHVSVIAQKEPHFLPPVQRTGFQKVEVRINSMPRSDKDVHTTQNCRFRARALPELGARVVVSQFEVGLNPHIGLTQGHKGHHVQDPREGQVMQFQAIELQQRAEKSV
jgi:hypothetical protein